MVLTDIATSQTQSLRLATMFLPNSGGMVALENRMARILDTCRAPIKGPTTCE